MKCNVAWAVTLHNDCAQGYKFDQMKALSHGFHVLYGCNYVILNTVRQDAIKYWNIFILRLNDQKGIVLPWKTGKRKWNAILLGL